MKIIKIVFTATIILSNFSSFGQSKDFDIYDLKNVMKVAQFKGALKLKGYSKKSLDEFFYQLESNTNLLKQININSWGVCDYKKINNFSTYNLYYKKISQETFDKYCKELNALMLLDGTIKQLR